MTTKKFDIYEVITNRIIAELEKGKIPWHKPWKVSGDKVESSYVASRLAFNRVSKLAYSPLNQMLLENVGEYATYKQWIDLGGHVRKGAKAEYVVFWKRDEVKVKDEETGEEKLQLKFYLRYYNVFHISYVDGVEPLKFDGKQKPITIDVDEQAEDIINDYSAREDMQIFFGGSQAYYSPLRDEVHVPHKNKFTQTAEFYSTLFHELAHSTGAEHRLNRLDLTTFGSESYSKEELVAEISASGMLSLLGIETESSFKNNTAYIQSWLTRLKNDKTLIVSATSKAEKAINYIIHGKQKEVA